jgi:hypothetical protein
VVSRDCQFGSTLVCLSQVRLLQRHVHLPNRLHRLMDETRGIRNTFNNRLSLNIHTVSLQLVHPQHVAEHKDRLE